MKRPKDVFTRIEQQNRLLWLFLQHGTSERNRLRIFRVLFEHVPPFSRSGA